MSKINLRVTRTRLDTALFYSSYAIYLVTNILNASFYAKFLSESMAYIMIACVVMLMAKEFFCNKIGKREIKLLIICSALSLIILLHPNGYSMFPLFFFLYSARNIAYEKIAKFTVIITLILFAFVFLSAKTGLIVDYISYSNGRIRDYIGFRYALFPSALLFNITALIVYIDKNHKIKKYLILLILNYIVFKYTDSRLSFYLSVLLVIGSYAIKIKPALLDRMRLSRMVLSLSFVVCSTISFTSIIGYNESNSIMRSANTILENRLSLGKASLSEYPVSLWGQSVEYSGSGLSVDGKKSKKEYNYVDCLYLNLLEKYGLIFYVAYILLMTYSLSKIKNRKEYTLLLIMAIIAARGMIDDLGIYLYYNTFWFLISKSMMIDNLKKKYLGEGEKE